MYVSWVSKMYCPKFNKMLSITIFLSTAIILSLLFILFTCIFVIKLFINKNRCFPLSTNNSGSLCSNGLSPILLLQIMINLFKVKFDFQRYFTCKQLVWLFLTTCYIVHVLCFAEAHNNRTTARYIINWGKDRWLFRDFLKV